ncbi:hypothetical protein HPP92_007876 [Vanilla planifolia]|uniref:Uncharacterized protein n=1 Tax=Vanilla planifolia TaxID=51239 RepID=A0A835RRS0_VANPL|nr:hypothetical protein HPP92_007876 [Vanilla planifolia]
MDPFPCEAKRYGGPIKETAKVFNHVVEEDEEKSIYLTINSNEKGEGKLLRRRRTVTWKIKVDISKGQPFH